MARRCVAALLIVWSAAAFAQSDFPRLAARVPHFAERLRSTRWQVRYALLGELGGRDAETKRALELLARDRNEAVANQALVRYVRQFVEVDRTLFRPEVYFREGPWRQDAKGRALVDQCLAWLAGPNAKSDDPAVVRSIVVVGILGRPEDAAKLGRFLDSENDYVAWNAAVALLRLGDTKNGSDALVRLTKREPGKHLHYVTEALRTLREIAHPRYEELVRAALAAVDRTDGIQPNWLSEFLLLAAEVEKDVWTRPGADGGK
jgi:hypothetical protein